MGARVANLRAFEKSAGGVISKCRLTYWRVADSLSCMTNLQVRVAGVLGLGWVMAVTLPLVAQNSLPAATARQIDAAAADVLKATEVPSASVAVVQDGKVAFVRAYGM